MAGKRTSPPVIDEFGAALREAREAAGHDQTWLAAAVGISQTRVSAWERGHQPTPDQVFTLEKALGLDPGDLSRILGYLPVGAVPALTVPQAVKADPELNRDERRSLLRYYGSLVGDPNSRDRRTLR